MKRTALLLLLSCAIHSCSALATTPIHLNGHTFPTFSASKPSVNAANTAQLDNDAAPVSTERTMMAISPGSAAERELAEIRCSMSRLRARRRLLQRDLRSKAGQAREKLLLEHKQHAESLALLDDVQRRIVRSATAGLMKEQRAAMRKWKQWRESEDLA